MTEARIEPTGPDPWLAAAFLARARLFAVDGSAEISAESRQLLLHSAAIAACDAVLAIEGRVVTGSDGGHRLRLVEAERILPGGHDDLFEALDEARSVRHDVSYAIGLAASPDIEKTALAVRELLTLVEGHVAPHLPDWDDES